MAQFTKLYFYVKVNFTLPFVNVKQHKNDLLLYVKDLKGDI